jgi:CHRD domain
MDIRLFNFRRAVRVVAIVAGIALLPVPTAATASDGGRPLFTNLSGAEEVPPADPDGTGEALLRVNSGQGRICYQLTVANLDGTVAAAHIHKAPAGVNGPIVVPLVPPINGSSEACATVDRALAKDIRKNPDDYYVNVHTSAFTDGAVRGQL